MKTSRGRAATTVRAPAAIGVTAVTVPPRVNGRDSFRVARREFVGTASNGTTTGFAVTPLSLAIPGYDINPSVYNMFPWLSNIANCYERFRFNRLAFHFIPSQATSTAGRFYAAVDYDYDDSPAVTKPQMMGNKTAVETAVWNEAVLTCDPASLNRDMPYKYVSCSTRGLDVEGRTAFSGFLMCAFDTTVQNCLMDIWVEYDVELVTPVNDGVGQQLTSSASTYVTVVANTTTGAGPTFYGFPNPSTNVSLGTIRVVTPGTATTPAITWVTRSVPKALDIMDAKGKGLLDLTASLNVTGVTPNALLVAATALDILWGLFDSNGVYLAQLSGTPVGIPSTAYSHVVGPTVGAGDVAGGFLLDVTSIALDTLLSYLPLVRYIAPMIANTAAAVGAGYNAWGFRYKQL